MDARCRERCRVGIQYGGDLNAVCERVVPDQSTDDSDQRAADDTGRIARRLLIVSGRCKEIGRWTEAKEEKRPCEHQPKEFEDGKEQTDGEYIR